jgi:hypothetical protein
MQSAKDALPALLPIGLGQRGGEFDKMFMDTLPSPSPTDRELPEAGVVSADHLGGCTSSQRTSYPNRASR